ncbi:MAG: hypothetical protein M3178_01495 [Pseudomonadota bacterium]|nr:hypothetical protein [Pseudomonadota bacterium]
MTSCGYTPAEIDEVTLHDVLGLFAYWRDFPPAHEILKSVYRIEQKQERPITTSKSDPSGIGGLVARFPDGFVRVADVR